MGIFLKFNVFFLFFRIILLATTMSKKKKVLVLVFSGMQLDCVITLKENSGF